MNVAIADDAAVMRAVLAHALAGSEHAVVGEASDLASALALCERARPDVVVVDSRLPPSGACEFVRALHARGASALVVVVAALGEIAIVREAVAAGARAAIRRPVRRDDVLAALRAC